MKKLLFLLLLIPSLSQAQTIQSCQSAQTDATVQTTDIANETADIQNRQTLLAADNITITQCNQNTAQTAASVNWDYFVGLESSGIRYAQWSAINSSINWAAITPTLGINCGGIVEANVNWPNWSNCEAKGMTPGLPFGGKNTGIAAFWCGNGSINGTC